MSTYQDILSQYNFTNLPDSDSADSLNYPKQKDVNDYYTINYEMPTNMTTLLATGYYTTGDQEYIHFRQLEAAQASAVDIILHNDQAYDYTYSVFFSDVAKINFVDNAIFNADIVLYQNDVNSQIFQNALAQGFNPVTVPGFTHDYSVGDKKYGDVLLNEDYVNGWSDVSEGSGQFETILHEINHALGFVDFSGSSVIDNQKYTIMSYTLEDGMSDIFTQLFPSGLQLEDIAALQEIYGADETTRLGDTTYGLNQGFGNGVNDPFIYTIWDAGGDHDKIDASGYADGVKIDLRAGNFSSIGKSVKSDFDPSGGRGEGLAIDNVAIAYGAKIEDATGTSQADYLIGNEWVNRLEGGSGNDILEGGLGDDILVGGGGTDAYNYTIGDGVDTIIDSNSGSNIYIHGNITNRDLQYSVDNNDLVVSIPSGGGLILKDYLLNDYNGIDYVHFDNEDRISWSTKGGAVGKILYGTGTENNTTGGDDVISAGDGSDTIFAYDGKDLVFGGDGNDTIYQGGINYSQATIFGQAGNDTIRLESQNPITNGSYSTHKIYGGVGNDSLSVKGAGSSLFGGDGDDTLAVSSYSNIEGVSYFNGEAGNDKLKSYANTTVLKGGTGDDLYVHRFSFGTYMVETKSLISDSNGTDVIGIEWNNFTSGTTATLSDFTYEKINGYDLRITHGSVTGFIEVEDYFAGSSVQSITISPNGIGNAPTPVLISTFMPNITVVAGTASGDTLHGSTGTNYVYGYEGDDYLYGDGGDDDIYGGAGNDRLYGEGDNDTLYGEAGNDYIYGHEGADTLYGGDGVDTLYGDVGIDVLNGGADGDKLYGGAENDTLNGNAGNDKLYGDAGSDTLNGDAGTDTLYGGDDNDILIGGTGTDFLYGQGGADTFKLDLNSIDRLSDFDASEGDTIDIADLLIGYDSATDDINDFVTLVYRNAGRIDIRVNDDGLGNDLPYVGIVFSDLTGETVDTLVANGSLIVE